MTVDDTALTREYQEQLIVRMLGTPFLESVVDYVDADIFDRDLASAAEFIIDTFRQENAAPTKAQVQHYIPTTRLPVIPKDSAIQLDIDGVIEFAEMRRVRKSLLLANQQLILGDTAAAVAEMTTLRTATPSAGSLSFDYFDPDNGVENNRGTGLSLGLPTLDEATGGVCRGEMALVMAATNGGKSTWLVHIAALAVAQGLNVFFASLEMPAHAMKMRFEAKFKAMDAHKGTRIMEKDRGNLDIFCAPPSSIDSLKLRSGISGLIVRPDVVIIDSGDLMVSSRSWGNQWEEEKEVFESLKALALEEDVMLWVATQANRQGYGKELIKLENVKGSIGKVQIVDHCISLNQDEGEATVNPDTGMSQVRVYLAKCRFGPKGAVAPCEAHMETCAFNEEAGVKV